MTRGKAVQCSVPVIPSCLNATRTPTYVTCGHTALLRLADARPNNGTIWNFRSSGTYRWHERGDVTKIRGSISKYMAKFRFFGENKKDIQRMAIELQHSDCTYLFPNIDALARMVDIASLFSIVSCLGIIIDGFEKLILVIVIGTLKYAKRSYVVCTEVCCSAYRGTCSSLLDFGRCRLAGSTKACHRSLLHRTEIHREQIYRVIGRETASYCAHRRFSFSST